MHLPNKKGIYLYKGERVVVLGDKNWGFWFRWDGIKTLVDKTVPKDWSYYVV